MPLPGLLRACHPEPTLAVTALATALAASAGARTGWVAAAFLTGQLTTGWTNDWRDGARDLAAGRADKPVARGEVSRAAVGRAAVVAALLCVPLSLAAGLAAGAVHLLAVLSAAGYNLLLKGSWASPVPYAVSFGLVPSVVTLSAGAGWAPAWATGAGALLGVGAHLANALPDLDDDLAAGLRGLPHRLGRGTSAALSALLLLAATAVLVLGPGTPGRTALAALVLAALVVAGGLLRARRPGSRDAFRAAVLVALLDVGLLVGQGADLVPG